MAKIGETECEIADGDVGLVPSGVFQNFRKTGSGRLKLFTTCNRPGHAPGTEHPTRAKAQADAGA